MGWLTPTSHSDPSSVWNLEASAYDDNEGSAAFTTVPAESWSGYLELEPAAAISCAGGRFMATKSGIEGITLIEIDFYYDGDWHNAYSGDDWEDGVWKEVEIVIETSAKVRVRGYNGHGSLTRNLDLFEFDFNESVPRAFGDAVLSIAAKLGGDMSIEPKLKGTLSIEPKLEGDLSINE